MKRVLIATLCLFSLVGAANAQLSDAAAKRSEAIVKRMRQLDLLNHIIPLALTKDQINKILPVIEKCRQKVKQIQSMEADDLKKVEIECDKAYDDGVKKNNVPDVALLKKLNMLMIAFAIRRDVAINENTDDMMAIMKSTLNAGQLKVAAHSLDVKQYDPKAEPSKMSDDEKMKFYIKDVMLDPLAYDVLIQLAKIAS